MAKGTLGVCILYVPYAAQDGIVPVLDFLLDYDLCTLLPQIPASSLVH